MKCTSRKISAFLCILLLMILFSGCTKKQPEVSYKNNNDIKNSLIRDEKAISFAQELCVVNEDVTENTKVEIEEVSAAGLFDVNNHEVIYAKDIHERLYPASLTKIMTALVALKYGNTEDTITVTENVKITEPGAQLCGLKAGDQLTLNQALHALLIDSANDSGLAIAEHVGGSIENFTQLMNEEAVAIGATNSHFVNPHGLSDNDHYVTAYDMYLIMNEAMKYPLFNEIIHMNEYETVYYDKDGKEKKMSFQTTNLFLRGNYSSPEKITVIGGKTGTTNAAGNCLILLARDTAGNPYISVILRASERDLLYNEMIELLKEINN